MKIHIIDDNYGEKFLLEKTFQNYDHSIELLFSRDGQEALSLLESIDSLPDLILLDLKMPRLSGIEFLQRLRKQEKIASIPVFIYSFSSELSDKQESFQLQVKQFYKKPTGLNELKAFIPKLLSDFNELKN